MLKKYIKKGFTLIELLVAMTLLILLGMLVVRVVQDASLIWHHTENQNNLHTKARKILSCLQDDLQKVYAGKEEKDSKVRFILDKDKNGNARLRFSRRFVRGKQNPLLRKAGEMPLLKGYKDYHLLPIKSKRKLRALGGLAEVMYTLLPGDKGWELWRGLRSPIGGTGSFFYDKNIDSYAKIRAKGYRVSSDVLYFGLKCWQVRTRSWDEKISPNAGGPLFIWKSLQKKTFPIKVQITLAMRTELSPVGKLQNDIDDSQTSISLQKFRYFRPSKKLQVALIGNEWISYDRYEEGTLSKVQRGILSTKPQNHTAGTSIYGASLFRITVYIPTHRNSWQ